MSVTLIIYQTAALRHGPGAIFDSSLIELKEQFSIVPGSRLTFLRIH